jgi:hypothetical protein
MANYIPYDSDSIFRWYDGNDPDRYTNVNSTTLNLIIDETVKNDEKLDSTIFDIINGNIVANKFITNDLEIKNSITINDSVVTSTNNKLSFVSDENTDTVIVDAYKGSFRQFDLNGSSISYDNQFNFLLGSDYTDIQANKGIFTQLNINNSVLSTVIDDDAGVEYLDFKVDDDYEKSFFKTGGMYLVNSYLNFGSHDLKDAIVYDDGNDGDTQNSYLFYADGEVSNSTLQAGEFKTVGADLAEYYEMDDVYSPGTIIGIGEKSEGTFYKKGMKLLGVISENAGYVMNSENKFMHAGLIGLKGRVVVELNGSAKRGDFLIADDNGTCVAYEDYTFEESKYLVGIAIEDGQDFVLAKI